MSKAIYRLEVDCGRMGSLEGVFCADIEDVKELLSSGKKIRFGEVLGKHSEVFADFNEPGDTIDLVTDDPVAIEVFEKYGFASGYNPFNYINE